MRSPYQASAVDDGFPFRRCELIAGYGFRYYDPVAGRWLSRDPIGEVGDLGLYLFALNNPLSYFDAVGWFAELAPYDEDKCRRLKSYRDTQLDNAGDMIDDFDEFRDLINYVRNWAYAQIFTSFSVGAVSAATSIIIRPAVAASSAGSSFAAGTSYHRVVVESTRQMEASRGIIMEAASTGASVGASFFFFWNTAQWATDLLNEIDAMSATHRDMISQLHDAVSAADDVLNNDPCCSSLSL